MYQNKIKRFRRHSNGRSHQQHGNGGALGRLRTNSFSNIKARNHFRTPQSAEKLFEKYNTLAKEAMSSGDKTLSENYLQHADHFLRIIDNKNINQNQNRVQTDDKLAVSNRHLDKNSDINQEKIVEEKEEKKNKILE